MATDVWIQIKIKISEPNTDMDQYKYACDIHVVNDKYRYKIVDLYETLI